MNKHIKHKKFNRMYDKKYLDKESLLFIKQFPHLFLTSSCYFIPRVNVKRVYKKVIKYSNISKDEFETSLKMILVSMNFSENIEGRTKYYLDLYTKLGIIFKDNDGKFKLRCR